MKKLVASIAGPLWAVHVKIMSNVAIEAKVVQAAHLLLRLYLCHYRVRVLLVSPLLAEQLVQVDGLKGAHLRCVFDKLVQVSLLSLFSLCTLFGKVDACHVASLYAFLALLLVVMSRHRA